MAQFVFRLPDIGEGVAEAEIVAWHVKVGDRVEEDQSLCDVMTDKATVDMTTPVAGIVKAMHGDIGQAIRVGSPLVEFETEGAAGEPEQAEPSPLAEAAEVPPPAPPPPPPKAEPAAAAPAKAAPKAAARPAPSAPRPEGQSPLASPSVRARAHALGVPLQYVQGSGPAGRVTGEDLEAYHASGGRDAATPASGRAPRAGVTEIRIVGLRRKIAEKMQESKRRIPHFSYVEEFDMTELEALRQSLNGDKAPDQPKLTLLPFFMRAVVQALPAFPHINARYDDEAGVVRQYDGVHIGIATQTPNGLIVPVVRHAEARDLWDCAREMGRVSAAARAGTAAREELSGSTITLTSLGTLGGIAATPVINHPEVAIIGPNKLVERPVVRDGQIVVRKMMNLSTSFDHRIVDGYDAASFVQRIKTLIEHPARLFMEPSA